MPTDQPITDSLSALTDEDFDILMCFSSRRRRAILTDEARDSIIMSQLMADIAVRNITVTEPRASLAAVSHTQRQAAELLGVALRTMEDWCRGVTAIPPPMLRLYRHLAGLERIPFRRS